MASEVRSVVETDYDKGRRLEREVHILGDSRFVVEGKLLKVARLQDEYSGDVSDPEAIVSAFREQRVPVDILTFWDRVPGQPRDERFRPDPLPQALLPVSTYEHWWNDQIGKAMRKYVRRASRKGVSVEVEEFDEELLVGIKAVFDESPVRRNRRCWHYGKSLDRLRDEIGRTSEDTEFLVARFEGKVIGFIKMIYRDKFADPVLFMSMRSQFDRFPNNVLLSKAVERCAERQLPYIHYSDWRVKTHADFLRRNGFERRMVYRYYLPVSALGRIALSLGFHRMRWKRLPERLRVRIVAMRGRWLKATPCSNGGG